MTSENKKNLADEIATKVANNKLKTQSAANDGTLGSNMFDLENYPIQENKPNAMNITGDLGEIKQPINNTTGIKTQNNNPNPVNKPDQERPSNMLVPDLDKKTPPANNLATAINNLNKTNAPQAQQQTGGAKTLKKSKRGVLSSVADVLGLHNTTQKNLTVAKRGRPRKTKSN